MDRSLTIALLLALAGPALAAQAGEAGPTRVAEVRLALPPGEDAAAVRDLLAVAPGDPLSSRALRRSVQRLYQTGRFRQLRFRAVPAEPPDGGGERWVTLVLEAEPVTRIGSVSVRWDGPAAVDAEVLRAAARLVPGEPYERADLDVAQAGAAAELARRGWRAASVRASEEPNGVVVLSVKAGEPVRIAAVRVIGEPGGAAATSAALRARVGEVLDEAVLAADLRALGNGLREAGWRRARVLAPAVDVDGARATVEVRIEPGPRFELTFRGNAVATARQLERELGLDPELPLDLPAIDASAERIRAWYRARGHAAVRVEVEEGEAPGAVRLTFHVEEGVVYRMGALRIDDAAQRGARFLRARLVAFLDEEGVPGPPPEADRARVALAAFPGTRPPPPPEPPGALPPSRTWDPEAWDRAGEKVADLYRADGWLDAVYLGTSATLDASRRSVDVTVRFLEGARIHVESIGFEGNVALPVDALARESRLAPGDPLAFEKVEETRSAILRRYLAAGYLYARVEAREDLDRTRHVAALRFAVEEGPRVRIGRVVLSGNRRTRDALVRRAVEVQEGQTYDPDALARSQAALLRLGVFRSVELRLQEAEVPAEVKDLAVELAERPYATLAQGVGFSIANGPRATVEYLRPNLFGRAVELTARAKANYPVNTALSYRPELVNKAARDVIEGRVDLGLRAPGTGLPVNAGLRTDLIGEILHRRAYDLRRVAAITGVDFGLASRLSYSLQYELELDDINKTQAAGVVTQADLERLRFDKGVTTLHAVRPSVTLDLRDNSAHPHSGLYAFASAEYQRSLGDGGVAVLGLLPGSEIHTNLVKVQATGSMYWPVGASVIALSLRGGRVFPLDGDSKTIVPRRFFLGGAASMRGYTEEEMTPEDVRGDLAAEGRYCATSPTDVGCTDRGRRIAAGSRPVSEGGEAFVLAKGELRVPVSPTVELGLFLDFGNLWLDPSKFRVVDLRANAGAGVRFVTPIGPAALDVGLNLTPDHAINERGYAAHFTIGLF
ncbi:MAG: POTRA domain-containing protein [Anaeromyxobacteraceae bacterium]